MTTDFDAETSHFEGFWSETGLQISLSREHAFEIWRLVAHLVEDARPGVFIAAGEDAVAVTAFLSLARDALGIGDRQIHAFAPLEAAAAASDVVMHDLTSETIAATRTGAAALAHIGSCDAADGMDGEAVVRLLYARLCPGGALCRSEPDDQSALRRAIAAGFPEGARARLPFLSRFGVGGCVGLKPPTAPPEPEARYDYAPPGFADPDLAPAFPTIAPTNPAAINWRWLRKNTPHIWRTDIRSKTGPIGVLSYEEALVLHNVAKPFRGAPGLEIGCHLAWSTAHLVAAGLDLDVIDPALGAPAHLREVEKSLKAVGERMNMPVNARLHAGFSPSVVAPVAAQRGREWSFAFIDGYHDGEAPALDAAAVLPFMAETAAVAFHDLLCPSVFAGLEVFRNAGWRVKVFETTQVMGLAWRGDYQPPAYAPDPNMPKANIPGAPDFASFAGDG